MKTYYETYYEHILWKSKNTYYETYYEKNKEHILLAWKSKNTYYKTFCSMIFGMKIKEHINIIAVQK
jgi:hypothetical protein